MLAQGLAGQRASSTPREAPFGVDTTPLEKGAKPTKKLPPKKATAPKKKIAA